MTELDDKPVQYRKHLRWGEHDPHRRQNTPLGMWAWLWQRVSALIIVVLLVLHITLPYKLAIQFLLLLTVTFHASLGLRVIPWTVNEPAPIASMLDLGVDGIISDRPDRVREEMRRRGMPLPASVEVK